MTVHNPNSWITEYSESTNSGMSTSEWPTIRNYVLCRALEFHVKIAK